MSCRDEAMVMSEMSSAVRAYWSVMAVSWVRIISVMACTFSTCMPLSPLRNSTMCDKMYTMRLFDFSRS